MPATPQGTLEVFEFSQSGDDTELNKVVVPVVFGVPSLIRIGASPSTPWCPGDTLSGIAQRFYGDGALFPRIFEANRDQISNLNLV